MGSLLNNDWCVGQKVVVKGLPTTLGHVRTPEYIRGKIGFIERIIGSFKNPEQLAYGHHADKKILLRVRFKADDVWRNTPRDETNYTLDVELYEHWLERLE